ncbi:MAG: hypothetical protein Q9226_006705, partial [Calogaya cf. arnoldii]
NPQKILITTPQPSLQSDPNPFDPKDGKEEDVVYPGYKFQYQIVLGKANEVHGGLLGIRGI